MVHGPGMRELARRIAPGADVTELGGWMSRNLRLEPAGLVLRLHPREVSRSRLLAIQRVRGHVAGLGLTVPVALARDGSTAFRCEDGWAELEAYIPHEQSPHERTTWETCGWMFGTMGTLHHALTTLGSAVPRPPIAMFASPSTLQRWARVTEEAVAHDPRSAGVAHLLRHLVDRMRGQWISPAVLPTQLVHGDIKPENVSRAPDGRTVYLDFGFVARRPRIHDLAFSLTHTVLTVGGTVPVDPDGCPWEDVPGLVERYEEGAGWTLTATERAALAPYTVACRLYFATRSGFGGDPLERLHNSLPALQLCRWLLDHPLALTG